MGRNRRRVTTLLGLVLVCTIARSEELPVHIQDTLQTLVDRQMHFDQPGVYALLTHLHKSPIAPGRYEETLSEDRIPEILRDPHAFRGKPLRIRARVGRNSSWQRTDGPLADQPIWQLELQAPGLPVAITALLTESARDIPLGAEITMTGYFTLVRSYRDTKGRRRDALLVLGHAPDAISETTPRNQTRETPHAAWLVAVATTGAAVLWLAVRHWTRRQRAKTIRNPKPAPFSVAEAYQDWQRQADEDKEAPGS